MSVSTWVEIGLFLAVVLALVKPLGWYMAQVFEGKPCGLDRALGWLERSIYVVTGTNPREEMGWMRYAATLLVFNLLGVLVMYGLQRVQQLLPLNPQKMPAVGPDLSMNTAVSFVTNTNWQAYGGETTMAYLTQMLGMTVQNFLSAAVSLTVMVALIRGFARRTTKTIGNFWFDLVRSTVYVLLPLSVLFALLFASQGVVQTFSAYHHVPLLQPVSITVTEGTAPNTKQVTKQVTEQVIAVGPAASQIAIKQLGTNGGGFFNVNSAHPFENSTPFCCFLELLLIVMLPAAQCYTYGRMVGDTRQGWAILAAMIVIFVPLVIATSWAESAGNPALTAAGADQESSHLQAGGNMEGKETRFGIGLSTIWATATTGTCNGSVCAMHDSFTPLGGLIPMWLIQLGEVVFGGVGSGLYGVLMFAIVAVFVAGLMVGRTPEYLGKKIEAFEMKMATIAILVPAACVLIGTGLAVSTEWGKAGPSNPGAHGFSQVLYAFSSCANNNGSAFAGLNANTQGYNFALALAMLFGRFWVKVPVLAIAGSLAAKKQTPVSAGTLPTHTPLFAVLLVGVILLVGALTFIPALALGPIVEQLQMFAH